MYQSPIKTSTGWKLGNEPQNLNPDRQLDPTYDRWDSPHDAGNIASIHKDWKYETTVPGMDYNTDGTFRFPPGKAEDTKEEADNVEASKEVAAKAEAAAPAEKALLSIGEKIHQMKWDHDFSGEEPSLIGLTGPGVPIVGPLTAIGSAASSGERKGASGFGNDAKEVHI